MDSNGMRNIGRGMLRAGQGLLLSVVVFGGASAIVPHLALAAAPGTTDQAVHTYITGAITQHAHKKGSKSEVKKSGTKKASGNAKSKSSSKKKEHRTAVGNPPVGSPASAYPNTLTVQSLPTETLAVIQPTNLPQLTFASNVAVTDTGDAVSKKSATKKGSSEKTTTKKDNSKKDGSKGSKKDSAKKDSTKTESGSGKTTTVKTHTSKSDASKKDGSKEDVVSPDTALSVDTASTVMSSQPSDSASVQYTNGLVAGARTAPQLTVAGNYTQPIPAGLFATIQKFVVEIGDALKRAF